MKTEEKRELRKILKALAAGLEPEYCRRADREILERIRSMEEYRKARTVFCYVGTEREIDTMPVILDALGRGKRVGVPKCISRGIMEVYEITGPESLVPGSYGIQEPSESCPLMRPEEIDLALVPCMACTGDGYRLGYGGGYYDRYLGRIKGMRAALCRGRLMRETVPAEEHDIRMDAVISEDGIFRDADRK